MYYLPALSINSFIQTLADSGSALMGEKKTTLCNVLFCVKHHRLENKGSRDNHL